MNNAHYAVHYLDRPSDKRVIESTDELMNLLSDTFGIRLPEDERLHAALDGLVIAPH